MDLEVSFTYYLYVYKTADYTFVKGNMQKVDASKNAKIMNDDIRLLKKHLANVTATEM